MGSSRVLRTRRCLRPQRGCSSLFAAVVLVVGLVVAIPASAPATSSMFTTIDGPGAFFTQATGINATGQIVGAFVAPTGFHGFLDTGGVFTLIDVPGADSTLAFRMNDAGQIVGGFSNTTGQHGFLDTGGVFTPVDVPGAFDTSAFGINGIGQIVGSFTTPTGTHGFLYIGGVFTPFDVPGASFTQPFGINDVGQIVGHFRTLTGEHGFLDTGGLFTTIDAPDGFDTQAWGIDEAGQIVGAFTTSVRNPDGYFDIRTHGFLDTGGVFTTIDVPGALLTQAIGINNTGQIVGTFRNETGTHGFLATPTGVPAPSTLLLLGTGLAFGAVWTRIRKRSRPDRHKATFSSRSAPLNHRIGARRPAEPDRTPVPRSFPFGSRRGVVSERDPPDS